MKQIKHLLVLLILLAPCFQFAGASPNVGSKILKEFYRLRIYHFSSADQEKQLDQYFQTALIPALHRQTINKIGVFKPLANDTASDKQIYVLIAAKSIEKLFNIDETLLKDKIYASSAKDYIDVNFKTPFYNRIETVIMKSFPLAESLSSPSLKSPMKERIYEFRSYEGASEKIFANKVKMFNDGNEIGIFRKLGFNASFYSEVIAGAKMPNLIYMTCFENKTERDAHWKAFGDNLEWKKISSLPEYKDNVSHIDIIFLQPADYSEI